MIDTSEEWEEERTGEGEGNRKRLRGREGRRELEMVGKLLRAEKGRAIGRGNEFMGRRNRREKGRVFVETKKI